MDPIFIIIVLAVLSGGGGLLWWAYNKNHWKFVFYLHSRDLKNTQIIKAKVEVDKNNNKLKNFVFKNSDSKLLVLDPTRYVNGKPVRDITYDKTGDYVYVEGQKIDDEKFMKKSLKPTPKNLALYQFQANQRKNPIADKVAFTTFVVSIIMLLFVLIGVVYTVAIHVKSTKDLLELSKQNGKIANAQAQSAEIMEEVVTQLAIIFSTITDGNYTRTLPSD